MTKIMLVFGAAATLVATLTEPGGAIEHGPVLGWGYNADGQVAIPASIDGRLGTATAISAGSNHSCAIQTGSGAVICWGDNHLQQATPPVSLDGTHGSAEAISAGALHTCAIQAGSGAVSCWGWNLEGRATPPLAVDGTDGTATAIAAGATHTCAIQAGTGRVICWGANLAYPGGPYAGQATPPASVDGTLGTATAIAAGGAHSCAIQTGTGAVICWGSNYLEDAYTGQATPPPSVNGALGSATAIAAGELHSCAIQAGTNAVVCWGTNYDLSGTIFLGQATPPPSVDGTLGTATAIDASINHSCAIQAGNGAVVCWGENAWGKATPPGSVDGVAGWALAIGTAFNHTLAIRKPPLERGDILVTDYFGGRVVRIDKRGVVDTFGPPPGDTNLLVNPAGIVATAGGGVYVADASTDRLIHISPLTGAQQVVREPDLNPFGDPPATNVGDQPWGIDDFEDVLGSQHLYVSSSSGLREASESLLLSGFQGSLVDGTLPSTHFGVAVRSDGTALDSVWVAAGSDGLWVWDSEQRTATQTIAPATGEWFLDVDNGQLEYPVFTRVQEAGFGGCAAGTGGVFTAVAGAAKALSQGGLFRCPFSLAVPVSGEIYVADAASVLFGGEGRVVKLQLPPCPECLSASPAGWQQSLFVDAATLGVSLPAGIAYVHQIISGCPGDCDGDAQVAIDELILGTNIALGSATMDQCPAFDVNDDRRMTIDELVLGVESVLDGCP